MNYVKLEPHQQTQVDQSKPATLKRDLLGGLLKMGSKVLLYHKIRMYIPHATDKTLFAVYDIEIDTFNDFFQLDSK